MHAELHPCKSLKFLESVNRKCAITHVVDFHYISTRMLIILEFFFLSSAYWSYPFQVSLRDPLRLGVDDNELKEIIGAAVSIYICFLLMKCSEPT